MLNRALRLMRVFYDMTQKELAEKLEISNSHLSEIESGKKQPSIGLLERYSKVFDIPTSSILFFSENLEESTGKQKAKEFISSKVLNLLEFIAEKSDSEYAK
jgi:transcriptional regulator with XRE-family HTH domain